MHRLLVATELLDDVSPTLPKEAARHLRVLRPEPDEPIELFDGRGGSRVYRYDPLTRSLGTPEARKTALRSEPGLTLFACVTKGSRWDWTIEKATELGVARIVPVISDRTIVRIPTSERTAKCERWRRIAEDAARQSDALWLPEICAAVNFRDSLALVRETRCYVGALTDPPSPSLAACCRADAGSARLRPPAVYVGPEGDFTPDELLALLEIAVPTSFGPTVLRAETAALYAVSVVRAVLLTGCTLF